ncbi:hypothetical protein Hanom_Chr16g01516431 [Helianthus anomalus]
MGQKNHPNSAPLHGTLDHGVWWGLGWGHELTRGVGAPLPVSDVSVGYDGAWVGGVAWQFIKKNYKHPL